MAIGREGETRRWKRGGKNRRARQR